MKPKEKEELPFPVTPIEELQEPSIDASLFDETKFHACIEEPIARNGLNRNSGNQQGSQHHWKTTIKISKD